MAVLEKKAETGLAILKQSPIRMLDPRAPGGVKVLDLAAKGPQWAATISLGRKTGDRPAASKKEDPAWIYLHEDMGDAPGIRAALEATSHRALTITMISDDINECWTQSYAGYGTRKINGDENSLTVLKFANGSLEYSKTFYADEPKAAGEMNNYDKALLECKPQYWLSFVLCEWVEDNRAETVYLDGFMPYRFRTSSRRTFEEITAAMMAVQDLNGGRLAGVPFTLKPAFPNALTPQGERRRVPRMQMAVCPPGGIRLDNAQLRNVLNCALKDRSQLALPAPIEMNAETRALSLINEAIEDAEDGEEVIDGEFSEAADLNHANRQTLNTVATGSTADIRKQDYFRATQGTMFTEDRHRATLISRCAVAAGVEIAEPSLMLLAETATQEQWEICTEVFCKAAAAYLGTEEEKPAKAVVEDIDPYADAGAKKTTASVPAEEDQKKPEEKPKEAPAKETTKPKARSTASAPEPVSYLALDREPTEQETEDATTYASQHLTESQFSQMVLACGHLNPLFVILQARKHGITAFEDFLKVANLEWETTK